MASLTDLLRERTALSDADAEWLRLLVGDWQLLSDLSFADLVLWVPVADGWLAVAHVRPTTGMTAFVEDVVGQLDVDGRQLRRELLHRAGPDDGRRDGGVADDEGQRQVHQRDPRLVGQPCHR